MISSDFARLLFVAGTTLITTTSALYNCWWHGATSVINNVKWHAERACKGWDGHAGTLAGYFEPGQLKTQCAGDLAQKINFEVQWFQSGHGADMDPDVCWRELEKMIDGCRVDGSFFKGAYGYMGTSSWWFSVDPNLGRC